jgi:hypothetical protein
LNPLQQAPDRLVARDLLINKPKLTHEIDQFAFGANNRASGIGIVLDGGAVDSTHRGGG